VVEVEVCVVTGPKRFWGVVCVANGADLQGFGVVCVVDGPVIEYVFVGLANDPSPHLDVAGRAGRLVTYLDQA
jgi:hypothetical protein